MAYEPKVWEDGPEGGTPITAADLNRLEQAVAESYRHSFTGTWRYDASGDATPSVGQVSLNHTDPAQATLAAIQAEDRAGVNHGAVLALIHTGSVVLVQSPTDPAVFSRYTATAAPTVAGSVYQVPVTQTTPGPAMANGVDVNLVLVL